MARIIIVLHHTQEDLCRKFALQLLIDEWEKSGHEVLIARGIETLPDADLAILHVNLSLVPQAYAEAAKRYPRVINGRALDIRKRNVSRIVLARGEKWDGRVIVKTDFNCGGLPELEARRFAILHGGEQVDAPDGLLNYPVYNHVSLVPEATWSKPHLIVERFLPEQDSKGFYLRTWIFLGDRELCRRFRSARQLVKGVDYTDYEQVEVPDFLRAERKRLGFDYGKFDFVMQGSEPILLDANKTPGIPPESRQLARDQYAGLAGGIDDF